MNSKLVKKAWSEAMALSIDGCVTNEFYCRLAEVMVERKIEELRPDTQALIRYRDEYHQTKTFQMSRGYLHDNCVYNPKNRIISVKHPMYPEDSDDPEEYWCFDIIPLVPYHRIPQALDSFVTRFKEEIL